jgi:hypothetical protein
MNPQGKSNVVNAMELPTESVETNTIRLDQIKARASNLMEVVLTEINLPIGLRTLIVEEWMELQSMLNSGEFDLCQISWKVHTLVQTLEWCRDVCANARLITAIELMDIELGAFRKSLPLNSPVADAV